MKQGDVAVDARRLPTDARSRSDLVIGTRRARRSTRGGAITARSSSCGRSSTSTRSTVVKVAPVPAGAGAVIRRDPRSRLGRHRGCVVLQTTLFTHLRIDGVAPDIGLVARAGGRLRGRRRHRRDLRVPHGARDGPVPHHPARPLGAVVRDHRLRGRRVPGRAWCAPRPGWRPILGGIGGLFGGLVFITVGRGRGSGRVPVVRQPADRAHRRDLRRGDRARSCSRSCGGPPGATTPAAWRVCETDAPVRTSDGGDGAAGESGAR